MIGTHKVNEIDKKESIGLTSGLCGLVVSYYWLTQKNVMVLDYYKNLQYPHTESDWFIGSN